MTPRHVRSLFSSTSPYRVSRTSNTYPATKIGVSNSTIVSWTMKKVSEKSPANRFNSLAISLTSPVRTSFFAYPADQISHITPSSAAPNVNRPMASAPILRLTRNNSHPNSALPTPGDRRDGNGGGVVTTVDPAGSRSPFLLEPPNGGQPQQPAGKGECDRAEHGRGQVVERQWPVARLAAPHVPVVRGVVVEVE